MRFNPINNLIAGLEIYLLRS